MLVSVSLNLNKLTFYLSLTFLLLLKTWDLDQKWARLTFVAPGPGEHNSRQI